MPSISVPGDVRKQIALVLKESFVNIARHAGATEAGLKVTFSPPLLTIQVEDNGRGLDAGRAAGSDPHRLSQGNGLKSMPRRIDSIGGQFTIENRTDAGTRVTITVRLSSL